MFNKRNQFYHIISHYFIIQKRSNFMILSLFNGGVIYISPLYEFLTFPSLGRFSNIQKYLSSLSFQDVKYSSTQYIVPGSKLWGIPALCYDLNLGMIFYFNQDFSASGVVLGATPHTHPQPLPCLKILVSIKNHPLTLVHNRGQVYAIPCFTGKYTSVSLFFHILIQNVDIKLRHNIKV